MVPSIQAVVSERIRFVARAFLLGWGLSVLTLIVLFGYTGDIVYANRKTFALGGLLLAVGLVGWSGSVLAGRGLENLQHYLDTNTNWSEADSRRTMATFGGVGLGWMIGVSATTQFVLLIMG